MDALRGLRHVSATSTALAVTALLIASCSTPKTNSNQSLPSAPATTSSNIEHFTPAPAKMLSKVDCLTTAHWYKNLSPDDPAARDMGSVPAGFMPVYAVKCTAMGPNATDSQGEWRTITEQKLTGNMRALVAALSTPSDKASSGLVCEAMSQMIPDLWLVNAAGQAVHVTWPQTAGNFSKPETEQALAGLRIASETTLKVVLATSPNSAK